VPNEVPSTESPQTIALIGATPIAELIAARAITNGLHVIIDDVSDARLQATSIHLRGVIGAKHCAPGPHDQSASAISSFSSLTLTQSIESAIRSADFLIDTLPDDLEVKLELFTLFDKFAKPNAIFITTGSIPIDDVAAITFCPDRCLAVRLNNAPNAGDITFQLIAAQQTSRETLASSFNLFARICGPRSG
jgi:3-hydroxybutyryl-CoA dehydrogenase